MDSCVVRVVVLMSMLVLAIAQADGDGVFDFDDLSSANSNVGVHSSELELANIKNENDDQVVPNGRLGRSFKCGIKCGKQCKANMRCFVRCMVHCKHGALPPSEAAVVGCTRNCAKSIVAIAGSNLKDKHYVEGYIDSCYESCSNKFKHD